VARCLRYLGVPSAELDDALQEVFLVVHRRLGSLREDSAFRSWLYAIALNVARHARRSQRPGASLEEIPEQEARDPASGVAEARMELLSLLACLDEEKREVLVLYHLEQLTLQEIADATGAPLQTVHSRLKAGVRRLGEVRASAGKEP
jgi:RNA polymerase sigma-70 factor (ECF subfamily)